MESSPVALDLFERAMIPIAAVGGALFGLGVLHIVSADDSFAMLRGTLVMWIGFMLWVPGVLAPVFRQRPWALTAGSVPAGVSMILAFGVSGLVGWGPTAGRPAYIWGAIVAALAFAAFGIYAHRDGIRRFSSAT